MLAILAILGVLLLPGQLGQILPAAARAKTNGRRRSAGEGMARLETSRPGGLLFLLATCRNVDSNALNTLLQLWWQVSGSRGVRISIIYIYLSVEWNFRGNQSFTVEKCKWVSRKPHGIYLHYVHTYTPTWDFWWVGSTNWRGLNLTW